MGRKKIDPVEKTFSEYVMMSAEQRAEFKARIVGLEWESRVIAKAVKPKPREKKATPAERAMEAISNG